jgi:hypothetical protein
VPCIGGAAAGAGSTRVRHGRKAPSAPQSGNTVLKGSPVVSDVSQRAREGSQGHAPIANPGPVFYWPAAIRTNGDVPVRVGDPGQLWQVFGERLKVEGSGDWPRSIPCSSARLEFPPAPRRRKLIGAASPVGRNAHETGLVLAEIARVASCPATGRGGTQHRRLGVEPSMPYELTFNSQARDR